MASSNETSVANSTNYCPGMGPDRVLVAESCVIIILASISVFVNTIFLSAVQRSSGHTSSNVRALLLSANLAILVRSIYFIIRGVYILCLNSFGFDRMALHPLVCAGIEFPFALSSMTMVSSLMAIGIERFIMTVKNEKTDDDRVHGGVKIAIGVCWIQSAVVYALMLTAKFANEGLQSPPLCYCVFTLVTKFYATATNNVYFGFQEIAILIFYVTIYWKNRQKLAEFNLLSKEHSLSNRYGVWSNVMTTRMLLPAATVHAVIFLVVLFGNIPALGSFMAAPSSEGLCFIVGINILSCIDVIAHPLLCVRFNERYRLIIGQKWPKLFRLFGAYRDDRKVAPDVCTDTQRMAAIACPASVSGAKQSIFSVKESANVDIAKKTPRMGDIMKFAKADFATGKKKIIDFRLHPEDNDTMLNTLWDRYAQK